MSSYLFCDETLSALKSHPELLNAADVDGTAIFLELFVRLWKILNVKGPGEDRRLRDQSRAVFENEDGPRLQEILNISCMVECMPSSNGPKFRCHGSRGFGQIPVFWRLEESLR